MHNKILKGVASVLGAALVLGSVVMSAVPAQAKTVNGKEVTYTAQELAISDIKFGDDASIVNAGDGAVTITLPAQWNQVFFIIPEEVKAAGWEAVKVQTGDSDTGYTIKLNDENGTDGAMRGVVADYPSANEIYKDASYIDPWGGDPAATEADLDGVVYLDFMNGSEGSNTITFKSVTFTTTNAVSGDSASAAGNDNATGDDSAAAGDDSASAATTPAAPKTGESMNSVLLVSVLGGLLLIAAAGMFVTGKKRR